MTKIIWNENLSVNIESIDIQHQYLVRMINEFYDNVIANSQKSKIISLIQSLKTYSSYHFATEEKYMAIHNYQGYELHKEEHKKFVEKVISFEERIKNGKMMLSIEITNFIKDWITNHIQNSDKRYSQFLIARGVK